MESPYNAAATAVVVFHTLWMGWVIVGLFLPRMRRGLRNLHLTCAVLTLLFMSTRGYCPLTDLEILFLQRAGLPDYAGGFIQHYGAALLYGELIEITPEATMLATMLITAAAITLRWRQRLGRLGGGRENAA